MSDAIKTLRLAFTSILLVCVIWELAYTTHGSVLQKRHQAHHLLLWAELRDLVQQEPIRQAMFSGTSRIAFSTSMQPHEPGTEHLTYSPLSIRIAWPLRETFYLAFEKIVTTLPDRFAVYSILPGAFEPEDAFPFREQYQILVDRGRGVGPVRKRDWKSPEVAAHAILNEQEPLIWVKVEPELSLQGPVSKPIDMSPKDPTLLKLISSIQLREHTIFGISLGGSIFLSGIGILIGAFSISLLGPALTLRRRSKDVDDSSWLLVSRYKGDGSLIERVATEAMALCFSVLWIALPILIVWQQSRLSPYFMRQEVTLYRVSMVCGLTGCLVSLLITFRLWRLRHGKV